jgi:hypothetical protein
VGGGPSSGGASASLQKVDHVLQVIPEGAFSNSDEGDEPFLPIVSDGSGGDLQLLGEVFFV